MRLRLSEYYYFSIEIIELINKGVLYDSQHLEDEGHGCHLNVIVTKLCQRCFYPSGFAVDDITISGASYFQGANYGFQGLIGRESGRGSSLWSIP